MFPKVVLSLVEIAHRQGLERVILSPGSRVAPLTLALVRHRKIQTMSLSDERSAAFTALGMAIQRLSDWQNTSDNPADLPIIGIACTSGTAAYNYAPAIAEAFYQEIPLLVLTADRPPEWIDQQDGQAIRQNQLYARHVKASYQLPLDDGSAETHWHWARVINEAFLLMRTPPYAPVHINLPFREPFYPSKDEKFIFPSRVQVIQDTPQALTLRKAIWNQLLDDWERYPNKLIVAGQGFYQQDLLESLAHFSEEFNIPILADITANLSSLPKLIRAQDLLLAQPSEALAQRFRPDLLISFGKSVLSKPLKLFLRANPAQAHWHIQPGGLPPDVFCQLSRRIALEPSYFFRQLFSDLDFLNMLEEDAFEGSDYDNNWQKEERQAQNVLQSFLAESEVFSELKLCQMILDKTPARTHLHLANSMPVRYFNMLGIAPEKGLNVFSNRGTSGIDGSSSTAVGAAIAKPETLFLLVTGDVAFFYDQNAFWNNHLPKNLRVILLNNGGGNIFRMIAGASEQAELEPYFETEQRRQAKHLAQDVGLDYRKVQNFAELAEALETFFQPAERPQLLEVMTDKYQNAEVWKALKRRYQSRR